MDNAEKTVVKGYPLESRCMLDAESYLLYFNDKLNIEKYNILNAFYRKTKDIEVILDNILYDDSEYALLSFSERRNIRQKFKEGNFEGYPSYKKIYEEAITKINKLKSLYPFLENLSDLDPGSYFYDGKIKLFSDCVCIDYYSGSTSQLIGMLKRYNFVYFCIKIHKTAIIIKLIYNLKNTKFCIYENVNLTFNDYIYFIF